MKNKFYSEKQAAISAAIAGPIPAGILIYLNYKALGKEKQAYLTLAVTLIATVLLFFIIFKIPEETLDKIPNILFTSIYGLIVYRFYHSYMAADVSKAMEEGAEKGSNWTVLGVSIVGLVITFTIVFGMASVEPFYPGELIETDGNELYYDVEIPQSEAQKLVDALVDNDFFGDQYGNIVRLQLTGGTYTITMVVDEEFWDDSDFTSFATSLKWMMEVEFDREINLRFESFSISGKSKIKVIDQ